MFAVCSLVLVPACKDDPATPPPVTPTVRRDLTQKWHVLNNIEYAYQSRRSDVYDELIGPNFTFFFASVDVGGNIPEKWGRVEEIEATRRLFESNTQPGPPYDDPYCRSIRLDLQYDKDTLTWVEIIPDDFPSETWYMATVFYSFTFEIEPDITFIAVNGARAQLTVRNRGTEQAPGWELVEFRDLAGAPPHAISVDGASRTIASALSTDEVTWGKFKSIYR
jgi:hypothetical protein